jgi:hypothetical protein
LTSKPITDKCGIVVVVVVVVVVVIIIIIIIIGKRKVVPVLNQTTRQEDVWKWGYGSTHF